MTAVGGMVRVTVGDGVLVGVRGTSDVSVDVTVFTAMSVSSD